MKAFISYSHQDTKVLESLHKHLAQLKRDGLLQTWEDREINAGGEIDKQVFRTLDTSQFFIALLSPDYIASGYCYEKEFERAMELQKEDKIIIIPVIVEPCDWQNTPFQQFKAVPKDGKAISTWENANTAFLDVVQNIRRLLSSVTAPASGRPMEGPLGTSRNYRVKKDFDSIEKLDLTERTFYEVKDLVKKFIEEIVEIDNIKSRIIKENTNVFECLLVNRNKISAESQLKISTTAEDLRGSFTNSPGYEITYTITSGGRPASKSFSLSYDEFHMFWSNTMYYSSTSGRSELNAKEIADIIWSEWLESVGIL